MGKNITEDFIISSSIWNTDKFLIESGSMDGESQIKVTAQLVAEYIMRLANQKMMSDTFVLPFAGVVDSATIKQQSISEGVLGVEVWFIKSAGRFAASVKDTSPIVSPTPSSLYDNWSSRNIYNDGFSAKSGKLYIRTGDDAPFWWNGTEIRQLNILTK